MAHMDSRLWFLVRTSRSGLTHLRPRQRYHGRSEQNWGQNYKLEVPRLSATA